MKKLGLYVIPLAAALTLQLAAAPPRPIPGAYMELDVDIWTNRGEGAVYRNGEAIEFYFRASDDCHVTIYSISTEGDVRILFPQYPDDGYVYGGVTYRLPDYYDRGAMRVSGPRGIEYVHAIATERWDGLRYGVQNGRYFFETDPIQGDPFLAMNSINRRIAHPNAIRATATTSFFIDGLVWYPRYTCRSCHPGTRFFDPYLSSCSRYSVVATHNYDYWWSYDYHPVRVQLSFGGPFWRFELLSHGRRRPYRYIDCAWGFGNYRPLFIPTRPHTRVEPRHARTDTRRSFERSYERVTYTQTRSRDYGTSRNRERMLTTPDNSGRIRVDQTDNTSARSRSDAAPTPDNSGRIRVDQTDNTSARSRSDAAPTPDNSGRIRVDQTDNTSARSRSNAAPTPDNSGRVRYEGSEYTSSRSRNDAAAPLGIPERSRPVMTPETDARNRSTVRVPPSNDNRGGTRHDESTARPESSRSTQPGASTRERSGSGDAPSTGRMQRSR